MSYNVNPSGTPQPPEPQYQRAHYQPPQYPAPQISQYAPPQQPHYFVAAPPTNTLSIIAFVSVFVLPCLVPVVLGHISLAQIKQSGEGGKGLAIAALILGYLELLIWAFLVVMLFVGIFITTSIVDASMSSTY